MAKIYDCFLYNGERDVVSLRMDIMGPHVEKFVIIEANKTFSGIDKPFYFESDRKLWAEWEEKILYIKVDEVDISRGAWSVEHHLRNELKNLAPAGDNDLIIIADADEIVNLDHINREYVISEPTIVSLPTYYHFYNNKSSEIINVTLMAPYKEVKELHLGNRNNYKDFVKRKLDQNIAANGGHFTYMFGYDIEKYIKKIQSFSHQEFNTPYFLSPKRISNCVAYNFDLFDRRAYSYKIVNLSTDLPWFHEVMLKHELAKLMKPIGVKGLFGNITKFFSPVYVNYQIKFWVRRMADFKHRLLNA